MTCTCPVCGHEAEMLPGVACSTEPHGETHMDEYAECARCHARTDWGDVADALEDAQ